MAKSDQKQWQWIIIGSLVGALLVYLQLQLNIVRHFQGASTMDARTFVASIGQTTASEKLPMLRKVVVYPPHAARAESDPQVTSRQIVTGEYASETHHDGHATYVPFVMFAPIPFDYSSKVGIPGADYSVRDLLDHRLEIGQHMTPYRFAWWATTPMIIALWGGGSLVAIGGIWPMVLALLTGAFSAKARSAAYDLDRFQSEPEAQATGGNATGFASDEAPAITPPPAAAPTAEAAVKRLDAQKLGPLAQDAEDPHHYEGEFYPVERNQTPHKT